MSATRQSGGGIGVRVGCRDDRGRARDPAGWRCTFGREIGLLPGQRRLLREA